MRLPASLVVVALIGGVPAALMAQKFTGTYAIQGQQGVVTLALSQQRGGTTTGTLSGNGTVIQLSGTVEDGELSGEATSGSSRALFQAALDGNQLVFGLVELGQDGMPNMATATELRFTRTSAVATAPPAAAAPRSGGAARPGPAPGGTAAAPSGGNGSAEDQQLRQLLLGSAWCSFSYSQASGSTNTSRNVFLADGRLLVNTSHEGGTVNQYGGGSTPNGSVYSQSSGGGSARWQVRGGRLYLDGGEGFQPVPLSITRNSNGYPIITADGKEYSQCN